MEQNNIDKLFKDKLASEEVEFNPAAWTAAESLIAQQTGASTWYAGKTFIATVIALLLTVGGTTWFVTTENSSDTNIASTSNNAAIEVTARLVSQKTNQIITTENNQTEKSIAQSVIDKTPTIKSASPNNAILISTANETVNTIDGSKTETQNSTPKNDGRSSTASSNDNSIDDKNNAVASNRNSVSTSLSTKSTISLFETSIAQKEIESISLVDLLATQELESQEDFSQPVELPINDKGLSILRNFEIRFTAGGGAAWGFRNPQLTDPVGVGYSPTAGFNIGYIVNSEFSFNVNVLYRMRTGLSNQPLMLNANTTDAVVAKSLHYLDVPLYLNYHSDRHSFQLGLQYSYLLTTNTENTNKSDGTTQSVWGKNSYFKNSDLAALIGYSFVLNEQLNLGARFNYGIFDVTGNQSSAWETLDKNIHFNLLLEYKLSKY
ncbi:MAG: PorT family protein [Flavobacteriales bacterium]|nr:PorT family protein [Flavobacteriales bacterium]